MYQIYQLKCNRIVNPIGYQFKRLSFSFEVDKTYDIQSNLRIQISENEDFNKITKQVLAPLNKRFGVSVDAGFLEAKTRYYWRIVNESETLSTTAYFETGLQNPFEADFIMSEDQEVHPEFHKTFELKRPAKSARLYVTGVGLYEAYLNDEKVGDEYLTPYCNDYDVFIQYQTYEVKDLRLGYNHLKVMLGNGWYKGEFGLEQKAHIYGDQFGFLLELHITYDDGDVDIVKSDTSWSALTSPIVTSNIYDGETQNYNMNQQSLTLKINNALKEKVTERISLPVKEKHVLSPELIINDRGEQLLDFKQNMVGFVRVNHKLAKQQKMSLSYGEILQNGYFYQDNLRTADATYTVIGDGQTKQYRSHFTFFGFRYVKVNGLIEVNPSDFEGVVLYSDLEDTGNIRTSNDLLNQLFENAKWGQRGNFLDVPTDCPQRDERLGWTADAQVFSKTACYNMDSLPFYEKYVNDLLIDQQHFNGGLPNYSPSFKESIEAGSVWGDAATIIPLNLYHFYGDRQLLAQHYPLMKQYVNRVIERDQSHGDNRLFDDGFHFGDWLAQDGMSPQSLKGGTDDTYIASMYYYYSLGLVSEAAGILNEVEDNMRFNRYQEEVKQAILNEYFSPTGRLTIDTQTGYILALYMGVYRDQDKIIQGLKERLKKDYYRIKTGFVGTPLACKVLIEHGLIEEAYRMLFESDHPSWLYQVKMGATTIWERWNSVLPDGSISGTNMNSLNHYAYGSVIECVYENIVGLRPLKPGFSEVIVKPTPHHELKHVAMQYHSPFGEYVVKWKLLDHCRFELEVSAPLGAKVQVKLPDYDGDFKLIEGSIERHRDDCFTITSSSFHCQYLMNKNHLHPYSKNSVILDLLNHQEAREVLQIYAPQLYTFVTGENDEFTPSRMSEITYLPMCYTPAPVVEQIDQALKKIKV